MRILVPPHPKSRHDWIKYDMRSHKSLVCFPWLSAPWTADGFLQAKQDHMLHDEIQISGVRWHLSFFFFFFSSLARNPYFYWEFNKCAKPAVRQPVALFGTLIIFTDFLIPWNTCMQLGNATACPYRHINNASIIERQWIKYTCASEIAPKKKIEHHTGK